MTKQKTAVPRYVTKEILKKELSASEKRLDTKIEASTQSMKDYIDSRIQQVNLKIQDVGDSVQSLRQVVEKQGSKMDHYFEGIVKMIEGLIGRESHVEDRLKDHACVPKCLCAVQGF